MCTACTLRWMVAVSAWTSRPSNNSIQGAPDIRRPFFFCWPLRDTLSSMNEDRAHLAQLLRSVEKKARRLSWSKERPWRTDSHVVVEDGVPVVNLHDLGQQLALESVRKVLQSTGSLQAGAVIFVTGSGQHSLGGQAVLKPAVQDALLSAASGTDWQVLRNGPARFALVYDAEKAPGSVQGALGPGFWVAAILFLTAVVAAILWG